MIEAIKKLIERQKSSIYYFFVEDLINENSKIIGNIKVNITSMRSFKGVEMLFLTKLTFASNLSINII
jgi:hypothetical protein